MNRLFRKLEAMFTAVAFAEEGEAETARRIVAQASGDAAPTPRIVAGPARNDPAPARKPRARVAATRSGT
jgi:hypothetical protein